MGEQFPPFVRTRVTPLTLQRWETETTFVGPAPAPKPPVTGGSSHSRKRVPPLLTH